MMKRVISAALLITFLLGTAVFAAPADVVGTPYENAVSLLLSLGLVKTGEGGAFEPDALLTRGEFTVAVMKMIGIGGEGSGESVFSDVTSSEDIPYINAAYGLGIVSGYPGGAFEPNEPITLEQAVKITVSALGRDVEAKARGGYPGGYFTVASQLKLLKSVSAKGGEQLTRGMGALILYNALSAEYLSQLSFGAEISYEAREGATVLSERLEIYKGKGQVTANTFTRLNERISTLGENKVIIGGKVFNAGDTNAADLLGYEVEYYYKEVDGENILIAVLPVKALNKELVVEADEISNITSDNVLEYWRKSGERDVLQRVRVSHTADWIFNGRALLDGYREYLTTNRIKNGTLKLLDVNNDNIFDIVFIETFVTYVVKSKSELDLIINDQYGQSPLSLKSDDEKIYYRVFRNTGEEITFADIMEYDVLSVAADTFRQRTINVDGQPYTYNEIDVDNSILYKIIVCSDYFDGKVDEINSDGELLIGEKYYKVGEGYERAIRLAKAGAGFTAPELKLGISGRFSVDAFGQIAAAELEPAQGDSYGFLLRMAPGEGIDGRMQFKILETNNDVSIYSAASKVTVNGVDVPQEKIGYTPAAGESEKESDVKLREAVSKIYQDGNAIKQLVRYSLNDNNELREIYTAIDYTAKSGSNTIYTHKGYDEENFSLDFACVDTEDNRAAVRHDRTVVGAKFFLNKETPLLLVPKFDGATDEDYVMETVEYLRSDTKYTLKLYDVTSAFRASFVVVELNEKVKKPIPASLNNTPVGIVEKVATFVDEDGTETVKIYYTSEGELNNEIVAVDADVDNIEIVDDIDDGETSWLTPTINVTQLKKGDVIQLLKDKSGKLKFFRLLFRLGDSTLPGFYDRSIRGDAVGAEEPVFWDFNVRSIGIAYGRVTTVNYDGMIFNVRNQPEWVGTNETEKTENRDMYWPFGKAYFYEYDRATGTISVVDKTNITEGQTIFIRINGLNLKDVIIIK